LHMVGNLLDCNHGEGGILVFRVSADAGSQGRNEKGWATWRPSSSSGDVNIRFEIGINSSDSEVGSSVSSGPGGRTYTSDRYEGRMSFSICKRIVQVSYIVCYMG
jgi:ethylene receptor